jgi:FAD-linked oxidoreductase
MKWSNWSGSVRSTPTDILFPTSEEEIVEIVKKASKEEKKIRVIGSGHSFSRIVEIDEILVSLDKMQGIISCDINEQTATVWAGTKLKSLGDGLFDRGLAQENMGDINVQSIAGALSTGTHGTGRSLGTLSTQILEVTFVNGSGEIITVSESSNKVLYEAICVSVGVVGVFTRVKLRLDKAYKLKEETRKESLDDCLANWNEYSQKNRNFEFFWFPHTDTVQTKTLNFTDEGFKRHGWGKKIGDVLIEHWFFLLLSNMVKWFPSFSKRVAKISAWGIANGSFVDWSHKIYATQRSVRFYEMEYNVPIDHVKEVILDLRSMIIADDIKVHFPIECRFVKADGFMISPAYERDAAYIAVHQFRGMPYQEYFQKAESIFRKYQGRPHWGKINYKSALDFKELYPKWDEFNAIRKQQDPNGIFLNDYLELLMNDPGTD